MSNELITINYANDRQTVSARELYENLEIKERFSIWWERCLKTFGLVEDESYCRQTYTNNNNQEFEDYSVPIDIGKHICMISGSEKAHSIRQYFIEIEKQWNSPEALMARALKMADRKIFSLESGIKERDDKIKELTPAAEFGITVGGSKGAILIRDFVKLLVNDGIKIGQDKLFSWLHVHNYIYRTREYKPQWIPYKQYVDQGLFKVRETPISSTDHGDFMKYTLRVTGKGERYFYDKLKEESKPA